MKTYILLFLLFFSLKSFAQNQNTRWIFGDSAGIDFSNTLNPVPITSGMDSRGSCVSIADSNGNLRLYAATMPYFGPYTAWSTKLFNSQNQMLIAADSITGEGWYNELALLPRLNNIYYLLSIGLYGSPSAGLYYTSIDMALNGGLGGVLQENVQIDNIEYADCLTIVRHGNGRDWWAIAKINNFPHTFFNRFRKYLITPYSVSGPYIQDFNDASDGSFQKITWHPSNNRFMLMNVSGYMAEFNFDRCSGTITLNRTIFPEITNLSRAFWEGAYSPNGNVFYVSRNSYGAAVDSFNYLLQYDLTAVDITASCDTLDTTTYLPVDCGAVRLAPDGKIYYSQAYISQTVLSYPYADSMRNYINENLGVINNPDIVGQGCNFAPFSFYLGGKRTYYGLPNNPDYSLGALTGSLCDTLSTSIQETVEKNPVIYISPNPATHIAYFNAQHLKGKRGMLTVASLNGELVFQRHIDIFNGGYATQRIDVSNFQNGMYFINLQTEKERVSGKLLVSR
jgi:hypothetical protein